MKSSTEVLRRLLDERGVEWGDDGYPTTCTVWVANGATWHGLWRDDCIELIAHLTPEQAIDATLGRGACENTEQLQLAWSFTCSECGVHSITEGERFSYCPNCGRKVIE